MSVSYPVPRQPPKPTPLPRIQQAVFLPANVGPAPVPPNLVVMAPLMPPRGTML
jgi:hypothetical protein